MGILGFLVSCLAIKQSQYIADEPGSTWHTIVGLLFVIFMFWLLI